MTDMTPGTGPGTRPTDEAAVPGTAAAPPPSAEVPPAAPPGAVAPGTVPPGTAAPKKVAPLDLRSRVGGLWVALASGAVVLLLLLIFILENSQRVDIAYFGVHGHLPLGVALLLAAVFGILLVLIPGTGRIMQLRRAAKRRHQQLAQTAPPVAPTSPAQPTQPGV